MPVPADRLSDRLSPRLSFPKRLGSSSPERAQDLGSLVVMTGCLRVVDHLGVQ